MIFYYQPITMNSLTMSIDNIVLDVCIPRQEIRDLLETIILSMANSKKLSIVIWESRKPGTFGHQTLFKLDNERSFWLGQGLIGNGTLVDRYRLDANPNKVGNDPNFKIIQEFLVRNSRQNFCRISRFDLAIDIPIDRDKCFLVKDRRTYIEKRHGVEFTQYLGSKSSQVGRVKLYNKAAEAKLSNPLTRLELTLDPSIPYDEINFPKVYCLEDKQLLSDEVRVTDTERFILNAILQGCGSLTYLGRKTRTKIEMLQQNYVNKIIVTKESYDQILKYLNNEYLLQKM